MAKIEEEYTKEFKRYLKNREVYRKLYNTSEGAIILTDMLNDSGFFAMDLETPQDIALEDSAKRLLYKLGIWRPENAYRIVEALLKMPYALKEEHSV